MELTLEDEGTPFYLAARPKEKGEGDQPRQLAKNGERKNNGDPFPVEKKEDATLSSRGKKSWRREI